MIMLQNSRKSIPRVVRRHQYREHSNIRKIAAGSLTVVFVLFPSIANAAVEPESAFILNTISLTVWGLFVMWMCAGFTMLEAGSVRTKNASVICLKNIGLYSITGITYYVIGFNLMYVDVQSFFGSFIPFFHSLPSDLNLLDGAEDSFGSVLSPKNTSMSFWFFQMVFVATSVSIVSGTLAERVKLLPFFLFALVHTSIIYPIVGSWVWGGGWLAELGFKDFAGSTVVHSTGGWAALAGAIVIGPRMGKFRRDGTVRRIPPSNIPAVTLGVFILWLGWFGFNCGSQLSMDSAADAVIIGIIMVNTSLAASASIVAALILSRPLMGRIDLLVVLNGAIAGLVAITAAPDIVSHQWAILIGGIGGVVCTFGIKLLEHLKIDDGVGAIPVHLFAGIWGTIAVSLTGQYSLSVQLLGILAIGGFTFTMCFVIWNILDILIGARSSRLAEKTGLDYETLGIESYPEFFLIPENEFDEEITEET